MAFRLMVFLLAALSFASSSSAAPVWGSDASGELIGSRDSSGDLTIGGIDGQAAWDNGGLTVSWSITENAGIFTYVYTLSSSRKAVSHWILEVTEDDEPFTTYTGTSSYTGPSDGWVGSPSNPDLPNDLYGIKFDAGQGGNPTGNTQVYTIVTDRAPVYGVGYWKDGVDGGSQVVAWTNSLNFANYKSNESLIARDFIVRPNGGDTPPDPGGGNNVPEPAAATLLILSGAALVLRRQRNAN